MVLLHKFFELSKRRSLTGGGVVAASLSLAARALRDAAAGFEPALVSGADCALLVEDLAAAEKACAAARARAAARAAECGAHHGRGFRDAADWLARKCGSSLGEAKAAIETAEALDDCPRTKAALVAGELSLAQAREITRTERECPGSEAELVPLAKHNSFRDLKETSRKRRLGGVDPEDLHARQHAARKVRHWLNDLGMVCLSAELAPEVGIPLVNRLDTECDRVLREANRNGLREPREAYAADAFVRCFSSGGAKARATKADVVVVVDLNAFRRGHTHEGEACHVVGGGPIPVSVAREMTTDAFLKVVLHDGVSIHTVCHLGRRFKAELRTALELGDPPGFEGVTCADGCGRRHGLQWDHVDPVANRGPTSFANLAPRCGGDHRDKTERDRKAGLLGGKGRGDGRGPP